MTNRNNKAHYMERGRHAYDNCGQQIAEFGRSKTWQHEAWQSGYKAARAAWRLANAESLDQERAQAKQRHMAYCMRLSAERANHA